MELRKEFETAQFRKGLEIRQAVLGEEYVKNSVANVSEFMVSQQKLVTEYCWGEVWTRDGLSLKSRSMINLAMLAALNRPNELKLHVLGALNNGVTEEEMQEVFLQVSIYCGVPAGLDSAKVANEVIAKLKANKT